MKLLVSKLSFFTKSIFCLMLFIFLSSCSDDKTIVATFQGGEIPLSDLTQLVSKLTKEERSHLKTEDDYFKFVRKVAIEKIILNEVYKSGLDKKTDIQEKIESIKKSTAFDILRDKNVIQKVKVLESDYQKYTNIYELYQIVLRTDTLNDGKLDNSDKLLNDIKTKVKTLDDFKSFAMKYSEDITASEGGYLGSIRPGIMDDEIDKVLSEIKLCKVSDIIETYAGKHLIWVNSVKKIDVKELINDRKLYEAIYNQKVETVENDWYEKISKSSDLNINYDLMLSKNQSDIVIKYKDRYITRKDVNDKVERLRQGVFPNPTDEELKRLVKDMAIKLVLDEKISSDTILHSPEYKYQSDFKVNYFLINEYINANKSTKVITDGDVIKFYNENKQTLFTFKTKNNNDYIQPLYEVEKFIKQKIESTNDKESRFELYRKIVNEYKLSISNEALAIFINRVKKNNV